MCIAILSACLGVSCAQNGLVSDTVVGFAKALETESLNCDSDFPCSFSEALHFQGLDVVRDSILVCCVQPHSDDPYYFKAYSTNDFNFWGSFMMEGKGPGEILSPIVFKYPSYETCLHVLENGTGRMYSVDVLAALEKKQSGIVRENCLSTNEFCRMPLSDSTRFVSQLDKDQYVFKIVDVDGRVKRIFQPYKSVSCREKITWLSDIAASGGNNGKVAVAMLQFPQIMIMDAADDDLMVVAVDKKYKNWKSILASPLNLGSIQYCDGIATSPEYIFAIYRGLPIGDLSKGGLGSAVHIFDWTGKFIYDLRVKESLGDITFDDRANMLYGIDRSEDKIVRYNLSEML